jgi:hypothetical protein
MLRDLVWLGNFIAKHMLYLGCVQILGQKNPQQTKYS